MLLSNILDIYERVWGQVTDSSPHSSFLMTFTSTPKGHIGNRRSQTFGSSKTEANQGPVHQPCCYHKMRIYINVRWNKLCCWLIDIHDIKDGIYPCHVLKSEILMVENHPLITMLQRHLLNVGEIPFLVTCLL